MKVVYILGAGASAQAVPTYKDFNEHMSKYFDLVDYLFYTIYKIDNPEIYNKILNEYKVVLEECKYFGTADTLAVSLKNQPDKLNTLKALLSTFIYFQHFELKDDMREYILYDVDKFSQFGNQLDRRYLRFWSSILNSTNKIPEDIGVICWNYDFQLRASLLHFVKDTAEVDKFISNNVVYMNGNCLVEANNDYKYPSKLTPTICDDLVNLLMHPHENTIKFSWENDSDSILKAKAIIKDTPEVVCIGYSFPDYNRLVDYQILNNLKSLKNIYIQDRIAKLTVDKITSMNGSLGKICTPITDTQGFYIPSSYYGLLTHYSGEIHW